MSEGKRYYRKKLTTRGVIYIAGEEVEIAVKNLSITGLLAELNNSSSAIQSIADLFDAIKASTKVDFYLPAMRLMGEADVVRADLTDGCIYLGLEFRHVSHNVDSGLYRRRSYRKEIIAPGSIVLNDKRYAFTTRNVSVTGLMIHLAEKVQVQEGLITFFDFKLLNLTGEIKVVWSQISDIGTYVGLEYQHMEKTEIKGIPNFKY